MKYVICRPLLLPRPATTSGRCLQNGYLVRIYRAWSLFLILSVCPSAVHLADTRHHSHNPYLQSPHGLPTDSPSTTRSLVRILAIHPLVFPSSSHRRRTPRLSCWYLMWHSVCLPVTMRIGSTYFHLTSPMRMCRFVAPLLVAHGPLSPA